MAFRYIESDNHVAAVACGTPKPRVLIVQPQRLFVRGRTSLLEHDFAAVKKTSALPHKQNVSFSSSYLVAAPGALSGGDWYDVFQVRDKIAFIIGDVAGHGIDAALTMNRVRQMMIRLALKHLAPDAILAQTNALMAGEEALFATALCGYIDEQTREIVYATAGHPPAVLAQRTGEASFLEYGGLMLGVDLTLDYQNFRVTPPEESLLVLYTDGVTEHKRRLAESEARFFEAVRAAAVGGVQDAAHEIQNAVFQGETPLDDAAILAIAFT